MSKGKEGGRKTKKKTDRHADSATQLVHRRRKSAKEWRNWGFSA